MPDLSILQGTFYAELNPVRKNEILKAEILSRIVLFSYLAGYQAGGSWSTTWRPGPGNELVYE